MFGNPFIEQPHPSGLLVGQAIASTDTVTKYENRVCVGAGQSAGYQQRTNAS